MFGVTARYRNACPQTRWDVIVIGGGVTGAGVALEAARRGRKALLLEQKDFAWGTSSRSSKMVHGGLRYIAQGAFPADPRRAAGARAHGCANCRIW